MFILLLDNYHVYTNILEGPKLHNMNDLFKIDISMETLLKYCTCFKNLGPKELLVFRKFVDIKKGKCKGRKCKKKK